MDKKIQVGTYIRTGYNTVVQVEELSVMVGAEVQVRAKTIDTDLVSYMMLITPSVLVGNVGKPMEQYYAQAWQYANAYVKQYGLDVMETVAIMKSHLAHLINTECF